MTAEAERVVDRIAIVAIARFAGDDIQVDLGVRGLVIQRRRDDAVAQGEHGQDRLQCADRPNGVTQRGFRGVDRGVLHTGDADCVGLSGVADRRRGGMGVDVVDVGRGQAR